MNFRAIHLLSISIIFISACNEKDDTPVYDKSEVQISAFVNQAETKSTETQPISKGVNATFYAVNPKSSDIITQGNYIANASGLMTGTDSYKMLLLPGDYNIYGLSENSDNVFPGLTQLKTPPLTNGVDYLWTGHKTVSINQPKTDLSVTFQHIATNLVFELENGNNVTINRIDSIKIQTPEEGAAITLTNPSIPQTKTFSDRLTKMNITGLRASYIILPVNSKDAFNAYFYITINKQSAPTLYSLAIQLPTGGYSGANSYLYTISVAETKLNIKAFTVSDWIINDNTNKPIIPQE